MDDRCVDARCELRTRLGRRPKQITSSFNEFGRALNTADGHRSRGRGFRGPKKRNFLFRLVSRKFIIWKSISE